MTTIDEAIRRMVDLLAGSETAALVMVETDTFMLAVATDLARNGLTGLSQEFLHVSHRLRMVRSAELEIRSQLSTIVSKMEALR